MHVLIVAVGTDGDVLPLLTLASGIVLRGHAVTFIGPEAHKESATDIDGVQFVALPTASERRPDLCDTFLCSTRYGSLFLLRHAIGWNRIVYETARSLNGPNLLILAVNRGILWADYVAHLHFGTPVMRVDFDPPILSNVRGEIQSIPLTNVLKSLAARVDAEWARVMEKLGVRADRHCLQCMKQSAAHSLPRIGLYPNWLAPKTPGILRNFGFISQPIPRTFTTPPDLPSTKTEDGIVFVAGTRGATRSWSARFFSTSIEICRALKSKGILLGRDGLGTLDIPRELTSWHAFLPLRNALCAAKAIVHHGGIGTAAVAMELGLPQLIIPRFGCQASTAEWLRRLGLCIVLEPKEYSLRNGARQLRALIDGSSIYKTSAARFAGRCYPSGETDRVGAFLEDWFRIVRIRPIRVPETGIAQPSLSPAARPFRFGIHNLGSRTMYSD